MSGTDAENARTNEIPEVPEISEVEEWKSHAVELKQALYASLQSEVMTRRELDEYRVREIEGLREELARRIEPAREAKKPEESDK